MVHTVYPDSGLIRGTTRHAARLVIVAYQNLWSAWWRIIKRAAERLREAEGTRGVVCLLASALVAQVAEKGDPFERHCPGLVSL